MRFATRIAALAAAAVSVFSLASPAGAATYSPLDGHYAREFGCRADQQVIFHNVLNLNGSAIGYIDLMYSVSCHAAWAHAHTNRATSDTWALYAFVHRNRDDREEFQQVKDGSQDAYSPMLYDLNMTSYARIMIDPNGCCGTTYQTHTNSY